MENIHEILACILILITISHGVHPCQFTTKAGGNHNHELQMDNSLNYLNQYSPSPKKIFLVGSSFPTAWF